MRDRRLDCLADLLVRYCTAIQPGQTVVLKGDPIAMPLYTAIYERLVRAGAHVRFDCQPDAFREILLRHGSEEQVRYLSPLTLQEVETIDASIGVWAETNTKALSGVDPRRLGLASAARRPWLKTFFTRAAAGQLKWVGTLYPTQASAQDAEMSLAEYEDFVFGAGYLDDPDPVARWQAIGAQQQRVADFLNGKHEVRFQAANGTDLTVNVAGMRWINCDGHENFPDGEVFTGPNLQAADGGVNGLVRYSFPAVYKGREVDGVELRFARGRVVEARATKNHAYLLEMLDQDAGARNVGEIAIGTNYQIQRFTRNTLFDEKIGGTFHLAVGAGYPETGNTNESGLHWDMVCDLRPGGTITVDGEVILRDGRFVFPGWPGTDAAPTA
jgi:aminopeptidase